MSEAFNSSLQLMRDSDVTEYPEHMMDWIESVSDLGVKALFILGPDYKGTAADREVFAVYPGSLRTEAEQFARGDSYGADWRSSNSPLSGFSNLRSSKNAWESKFLESGFLSVVRVEFPLTLNRSFECFILCDREMSGRSDAALIVYAMLGAWPLIKVSIGKGRLGVTDRELESLLLAAEGLTALQAADRMGCTERTITFHWSNAVKKLGADTKMAAIQRAVWLGLI